MARGRSPSSQGPTRSSSLMQMRRAQYSLEFVVAFAFAMLLFVYFVIIQSEAVQQNFLERDKKAILDLSEAIELHLNTAQGQAPGFRSTNLRIPEKAGSADYLLNNTGNVLILTGGKFTTVKITSSLFGQLTKGQNTIWRVNEGIAVSNKYPLVSSS